MTEGPLVTIVIPTLNAARFLADALASVATQSHVNHETVIVDGGSTDATLELARNAPGVRVIQQTGKGLPDAWNCGIAAARGELIAFLDSDDRWEPEKLSLQIAALDDPAMDCSITRFRFVLEPGMPIPPSFRATLFDSDHVANLPSALLARRAVFDRIGVFETRWPIASDVDWFARLSYSRLGVAVVPQVLVHKRVHDSNLSSSDGSTLNLEIVDVLRRAVARHRGEQ